MYSLKIEVMDDDDIVDDTPFDGEDSSEATDEEIQSRKEARAKILGFRPQQEIIYNSLLPYSDEIDQESSEMWNLIKLNLGKSVALREFRPGFVMWTARLAKYISLYGLKFSKEDHINLIKLYFEVLYIPDLDPWLANRSISALISLLKKRELLTPDDLQIEWRPLYELYEKFFYSPYEALGMVRYPNFTDSQMRSHIQALEDRLQGLMSMMVMTTHNTAGMSLKHDTSGSPLESHLRTLINLSRPYFPLKATAEMLEEWRPLMCPFDVTMSKAISYCEMFLPTFNTVQRRGDTFDLWLDELMAFWEACPNMPLFEPHLFTLFARLADHTQGHLDWSKHIPHLMTRIHMSFDLPVAYKNVQGLKKPSVDVKSAVRWITSVMNSNPEMFERLDQMFTSLDSYYNSANFGRHSLKLTDFLYKLVTAFVSKIYRERYRKKKVWGIAYDKKISDEQITQFVKSLMPVVLSGMYFKAGVDIFDKVLQNLAFLRPELVIPPVMDRLFTAFDTLTEPHKLTSSMSAVFSMARSIVHPSGHCAKEAPTQVIPLLMATLPAIDPNDIRKAMVAFQMISIYCTIVPLVDCSKASQYYNDLSAEEELICSQTAMFEDFVVEFLDKCFNFIESSSFEQTREEMSLSDHRNNHEESMKDVGMASTFNVILIHSEVAIYELALKKVQSFVKGRILETKIAGRIAASLCRCLVRARPEKGLPAFVPNACAIISELLTEDMINHEDLIDEELKFNLHILAECVRCRGEHLLIYLPQIRDILRKSLRMKSKEGQVAAGMVLRNLLRSLTSTFPQDYRSCPEGYDRPLKEALPIRLWGKPGNIHNLQIKWSIASSGEMKAAQELIDEFLGRELVSIRDFVEGKEELKREQLQNSLSIICSIIIGAGYALPKLEAEAISLLQSQVNLEPLIFKVHTKEEQSLTFKGKHLRKEVIDVLSSLQVHLLKNHADDHKSLCLVISGYEHVLKSFGITRQEFDHHRKSLNMVKLSLDNRLMGSRRTIRPLLIDRSMIQHESRVIESSKSAFTVLHKQILLNLFNLATSNYAIVRIRAQDVTHFMTSTYSYSYQVILDPAIELLSADHSEEKVSHESFKGALYLILGHKDKTMLTKHDWQTLYKLWPSILKSRHSEKPSVAKLIDNIFKCLVKYSETFAIATQITENEEIVRKALEIAPMQIDAKAIAEGKEKMQRKNKSNESLYDNLVDVLCNDLESRKMHWRHYNLGLNMLTVLTRYDRLLPVRAVKLVVDNLTHDNLTVRKSSIHMLGSILKQHKRPHIKMAIDKSEAVNVPGDRSGNAWLCYDKNKVPSSAEDWDRPRYVHKTHYGYYKWPSKMLVYAPSQEQPLLRRQMQDMNPQEQEIFKFFSDEDSVTKLIGFLSLEEQKGLDHFDARRFFMFKGLFRNYGDTFLHAFRPHLERLVDQDLESAHRCAAEIIAGAIRGMKHWPWDMTADFWQWMQPLLRKIVGKITVESFADWGTCFATASESRDPNRIHWLLEALMEEPIQSKGSFTDCSRLYALQGALAQQEWRIPTIMQQILQELKPFMTHSLLNVRDRLGSMLTNIFISDLDFANFPGNKESEGGNRRNPKMADFINEVVPQLEMLAASEDEENKQPPEETRPQQPPEVLMRPPPELMAALAAGGRPPPPEIMAALTGGRPPPPELLNMMRMPRHPAQFMPPEVMARLPHPPPEAMQRFMPPQMPRFMPPPEVMNRMPMINPQALRMIPPEAMLRGPPPPDFFQGKPPMMMPFEGNLDNGVEPLDPEKEEKQKAIRLLQAVCKCITGCLVRDFVGVRAEYYKLLPMLCNHESNEIETHLAKDCILTLGYMARAILPFPVIPAFLEAITQVSKSGSWKARASVLELLQASVFLNMPSLLSNVAWVHQVMDVVENALIDERVEVRSKAGQVLSGLLHCAFVDKERQQSLLKSFYGKVKKKKNHGLVTKHSAVLGLCAFVNAFPYDVPDFVPDILMVLSDHLHDPQPIPVTIKKTLQDFKRTHQDNWQDHKLKFSDDQLCVLTDLLVSPSYYA